MGTRRVVTDHGRWEDGRFIPFGSTRPGPKLTLGMRVRIKAGKFAGQCGTVVPGSEDRPLPYSLRTDDGEVHPYAPLFLWEAVRDSAIPDEAVHADGTGE